MIDRDHDLPLTRQAQVLRLSRSSLYYHPQPVSAEDLAIMGRIDKLHLNFPFAGSRMLRDFLRAEGFRIGRDRVITLMRRMGVEARIAGRTPRSRRRGTRSSPICCASWR
jgi:putative transposase